jgi:hypothetical protein
MTREHQNPVWTCLANKARQGKYLLMSSFCTMKLLVGDNIIKKQTNRAIKV